MPDPPHVLTSNAGWNTIENEKFLVEVINELHRFNIRTSIFIETDAKMIEYAARTGTDRVELYTESYAVNYKKNREEAVKPFVSAAKVADKLKLGLNAGHDLNLDNLRFFCSKYS